MELNLQSALLANEESTAKVISVADSVFSVKFNEPLVHQAVTAYLAKHRVGTRAQKSRSQVTGSGGKPWRQKGTGRARAGSIKSPLWRGGGVTFAAQPRDYSQKLNKKMYRSALRSILSELIRQERLLVVEQFSMAMPKTRELVAQLKALNLNNVLIIVDEKMANLQLAARNLMDVHVIEATAIDPISLIRFEKVLITIPALKRVEERLT